ncbi:isoleucine--tRNA ligase [Candidatus Woesearchaeota archaeon]|nr:isoleucine--tRNA ligase [Candidatus Woesearchaeota archaeon]
MAEKIGNYDFNKVEKEVLDFWEKNSIYQTLKEKNKGKKKFFFIQGPPYTSGRIHMGHAWNNCLKDIALRYKRMQRFDVFDRAAYDMHGLPTAHKVMELFKLKTKEDIIKFGLEKFIKECIKFSTEKADLMSEDLWRLGVWMDFENACLPINNSYIEGVWWLIKQAHDKKRLYEGLRTMSWCANCATAMAKHECQYKEVKDDSIFVKFPVKGKKKEFLIIWTTTPWTIAFNLAIMVHPELDYVKAKVGDETWTLAKGLAGPVVQAVADKKLKIIEEFKGKDLVGLEYDHPWKKEIRFFDELKTKHPKVHTIIMSEEYVNLSAGTGLVHCAPGCGPEDYEVGHRNDIPPFNNLSETGYFPDTMGRFSGLKAKKDDKKFVEALEEEGILIAVTPVEHDYAHCERCHNPVIFRTTKQWFFKVEDLKDRMIDANKKIHWVPEAGKNAFHSWLDNLRDNSITKQRFWGTPAPIWRCKTCKKYDVIGSAEELKEKAGKAPENLHKPWIDEVEISCECGDFKRRVPDVLDVWIDAGSLSWNILNYPQNKELLKKLFPSDFILEAKEQVRGWFNLLMVTSFLGFDKPCFDAVYMHGMLTDVEGVKMSKSLGNVISPYELIEKHGVDSLRYYTCSTTAGEDMNFSWDEAKLKHRNLTVLWNIHKYLIDFYRLNNFNVEILKKKPSKLGDEEKYILSKAASAVKKATELFEVYNLDEAPKIAEDLFLEISRTYIQLTRDKSVLGSKDEKQAMFCVLYNSLIDCLKIFSPVAPFVCEKTFQNLKQEFGLKEESIHFFEWPKFNEKLIDTKLEDKFEVMKVTIQSILSGREKAQLGVRWPLKEVLIIPKDEKSGKTIKAMEEIIKTQTNVKEIKLVKEVASVKTTARLDFKKLAPEFGDNAPKIIAHFSMSHPETVLKHIEEKGEFVIKIDNEKFSIKKEHLLIEKESPENLVQSDFRYGELYLNTERTKELDAEGFARELMRRTQSLRKEAGLEKKDSIEIAIVVGKELLDDLKQWSGHIKEKCGAKTIEISDSEPKKAYSSKKEEKIKGKNFRIFFNKL